MVVVTMYCFCSHVSLAFSIVIAKLAVQGYTYLALLVDNQYFQTIVSSSIQFLYKMTIQPLFCFDKKILSGKTIVSNTERNRKTLLTNLSLNRSSNRTSFGKKRVVNRGIHYFGSYSMNNTQLAEGFYSLYHSLHHSTPLSDIDFESLLLSTASNQSV